MPRPVPGTGTSAIPCSPVHQVVLAVAEEGEVVVGQPAQQRLGLGGLPRRPSAPAGRRAAAPPRSSSGSPPPPPARRAGPAAGPFPARSADTPEEVSISMCVHDSTISSCSCLAWSSGPTTSHRVPVTSRRTSSCGWMTWKLSSPCRVSSMVIESTRNGMSSVTMSTAPARLLQRRAHAPGAHLDQGAALRALGGQPCVLGGHPGHPARAGREQFLDGHVPVVGTQEVPQVADAALAWPGGLRRQLGRLVQQAGRVQCFRHLDPQSAAARYRWSRSSQSSG